MPRKAADKKPATEKKTTRKKKVVTEAVAEPIVETVAEAPAEPIVEAAVAETPVTVTPVEVPAKKTRKPRAKKTDAKAEPVLTTVVQVGDAEFDITDIAAKAYKAYKSTHKRKVVTEFRVYVKPEENAAYYTVNGEGSADFKIDL